MTDSRADQMRFARAMVLVASADKLTGQLIRSALVGININHVELCHDDITAKMRLLATRPDLLVADADSAQAIDGFGLTEFLRTAKDERRATLPVLMLMSEVSPEQIERAKRLRIAQVVTKPIRTGSLHERVTKALAGETVFSPPKPIHQPSSVPVRAVPPAPPPVPVDEDVWEI